MERAAKYSTAYSANEMSLAGSEGPNTMSGMAQLVLHYEKGFVWVNRPDLGQHSSYTPS